MIKTLLTTSLAVLITSCTSSETPEVAWQELEARVTKLEDKVAAQAGQIKAIDELLTQKENEIVGLRREISNLKKSASVKSQPSQPLSHPNINHNTATSTSTVKSTTSQSNSISTGRCQAITKKGTQCKRSAQPGSRYCWQHNR
jgi:uncharacterized coiled-coil protein SlyX